MTALSVNVNKIAVLRNSRGGCIPDPVAAARVVIGAGAQGITVHPRPDLRHIRHEDVVSLRDLCADRVELNIEGNPFAPPRPGYVGLVELAEALRPEQCTLVPDADAQLTSDHGFALDATDLMRLAPLVARLRKAGVRVSVFVDADELDFTSAAAIGIQRIELHTGPYAEAFDSGTSATCLARHAAIARRAQGADLGVNAGHDLSQRNLANYLQQVPDLLEVSIGHALVSEALLDGLAPTVGRYLAILGARAIEYRRNQS